MKLKLGRLEWLRQTYGLYWQDRGVLRFEDSRMESEKSGFKNSSQGTKELIVFKKFWLLGHKTCCKAENSSIQLLYLWAIVLLCFFCFLSHPARSQALSHQEQIEKVGESFEALYLQRLLQQMRTSNNFSDDSPSNPFRKSNAEKIYQSMLDQKLVTKMASQNPIGIKKLIVRQLTGKSGVASRSLIE